ncbi:MAG: sodium:solute symporter [Planctomycetes bacterium]|nr:sodium:solute symporter [Planctomycetota bacterium]
MGGIDWAVVGLYFLMLLALAWWVILQNKETASDYFLAGRHLGWFVVGASIFASNIGSEHLVGLAGSGATDGIIFAHFELHAWCALVLGWVFVPFYMRSQVFTMPEFLERRFSVLSRWMLSIISLVAYILTKIAVGIYAGGVVFRTLLPDWGFTVGGTHIDSFWIGSVLVILLTGLYTALGGFRAVAYTDAVQTGILILGSVLVTYYGLDAIGGWDRLREVAGSEKFDLWQPMVPEGVEWTWSPVREPGRVAWYFRHENLYPWVGMLFCAPIIGLWYWCTDQYIVQRALGARDETQARRGSIFASFLKLSPVFIFIVPGIICYALAKERSIDSLNVLMDENDQILRGEAQAAFPLLVKSVLPLGIRGIVVAGLLSALMSSLAGVFNACSTLFTIDMYQKVRPKSSQKQLVWVGRMATTAMVLLGLLWVPVISEAKGLYEYLQSMSAYLGPPVFVVFFGGVFFKRLNAAGCFAALVIGFALGLWRLAIDTPIALAWEGYAKGYAPGSFNFIVNNMYFQYFSLLIFLISSAVMVGVSYATRAPSKAKLSGLTYGTLTDEQRRESRASWSAVDVIATALVLVAILAAYLYFRG